MMPSTATVSIPGTLRDKLAAIAAAGFKGVEIFEQDFIAHDGGPRDVGQMVRDHGLEITLFQPFRDFEGLPEPLRRRAFARAERKFDLMAELGTKDILICSSCHPEALGGIDRMADDFAELGEIAKPRGIRLGFEALAWGKHVHDHRDAWEVVRRADHPNVGLILDSFHTLARKIDPDTIRRIPGDKIFFVQLADAPLIEMDLLYWSRHFRTMPGEGDLNVTGFMRAVAATGYRGPVSLEIFNDQFRGGSSKLVAHDGFRSIAALMDDVRRAEPAVAMDIPAMPARATIEGVEFLEFAARGADADRLAAQFTALGFAEVARHRSRDLSVWQQGGVRLLINRSRGDFAGSAYATHGATVCDIGLTVDDAGACATRAAALGSAPFDQPRTAGELSIPAIRGLGGSLLHFLDSGTGLTKVWDVEFEPIEGATPGNAGLTRIDHIAQTMSYDAMLSWSLFYESLFAMKRTPMVDVIDPDGLVRSQAIATPDGSFRVTLNGAETHRTLAGGFLAESFGASVQHVAFASEDIFATAEALAKAGFDPLPMSDNYYDDLAARFEIDPAQLARMKAARILYDEDAQGAFLQMYSRPTEGGMFFEIVQRVTGYSGYGAPNAPFRIAAQKRHLRNAAVPKA
ncbi:sugar phosphate isomerase/epimerase and 4-hydroxyphenylpyruvate domain-containing protein [Cereibacter sphaeroides]|nr:sugar phosphate isomerase/epimerase and 4-hydroxyphenylpyruvate domain-containing protein [Cereibacter sphaeroides]